MHHQKGAALLRKDQQRRLKYQESQRIQDNRNKGTSFNDVLSSIKLSEGQIKSFTSKLVK